MEGVRRKLVMRKYPNIFRDGRCWHTGATMLSEDSRASFNNPHSGWGMRAMNKIMGAHWTGTTRDALIAGKV